MFTEKEDWNHKVKDDLDLRNRNWEKIDNLQDDYAAYKDSNNLKVAKVEKELSDYQQTIASMNINQEAKQNVSGYGIVSLPKSAANGQVSVSVKGQTATNLIKNGDFRDGITEWSELSVSTSLIEGGVILTKITDGEYAYFHTTTKAPLSSGRKFYVKTRVRSLSGDHTMIALSLYASDGLSGIGTDEGVVRIDAPIINEWYSISGFRVAPSGYETKTARFSVTTRGGITGSSIECGNVFAVDVTSLFGAGNEPTVEQCDKMFANYFEGTKSTQSASKLKSVGKNLVKNDYKLWETGTWAGDGSGQGVNSKTRIRDISIQYGLLPNQIYTLKTYNSAMDVGYILYDNLGNNLTGHITWDSQYTFTMPSNGTGIRKFLRYKDDRNMEVYEAFTKSQIQLEKGTVATEYEPYTESTQYVIAKDEEGDIAELRSLPNGVKDEVDFGTGKLIKRVSDEVVLNGDEKWINWSGTITQPNTIPFALYSFIQNAVSPSIDTFNISVFNRYNSPASLNNADDEGWALNSSGGLFARIAKSRLSTPDVKGFKSWLQSNPVTLTYQLAEPEIIPIQVSGNLISNPGGTVHVEPVVADAGIYDNGISVLHQDLPIDYVEKLSRVDFTTGLETELDVSKVVVSGDRKSFTHPDLVDGDIVFFSYFYDRESTLGEATIEYYDSRYVLKDDVTGKFYKVVPKVSNGELINDLVEV